MRRADICEALMPLSTRTTVKTYDPRIQGGYRERVDQNIELFNAGSNGTIVLTQESRAADYNIEAFMARIADANLVNRRDPTAVTAVTPNGIAQDEFIGVKLNKRLGPIQFTRDTLRKMGIFDTADADAMDAFAFVLGQNAAEVATKNRVNTAISAIGGSLASQAAVFTDLSGATVGTMTSDKLNTGNQKMGDASSRISAYVMHSKVWHDLIGSQLTSNVSGIADVSLNNGSAASLNRPVLVTDSPALIVTGTPDKYRTLGLVQGAVTVTDTETEYIAYDEQLLFENISIIMQGEYAYNLELMGMKWNIAAGVNPTDAAIATGANWQVAGSINAKNRGGICILTL